MKKIILASVGVILALGMTGCSSNSASQSVKNLNAQLDRVDNAVVSSVSDDTSEISNSNNTASTDNLNYLRNKAYNDMLEERYLKDEILSLSSFLKSNQNTKYKLAKSDINALKSLTSDLSKYSTYLNDSKSTVKTYVKKIKNQSRTDAEHVSSSYQALSNVMNERKAYLNNLLDTMNEIADILCSKDVISSQDSEQNDTNNIEQNELNSNNYQTQDYNSYNNQYYTPNRYTNQPQGIDYNINRQRPVRNSESEDNQTKNNRKGLTKNIDTYNTQNVNDDNSNNNSDTSVNNSTTNNTENNNNLNRNNQINRPINNGYPYQYNNYDSYYGNPYYNNPYYNGYNNYYNPNFRYNRRGFNPNRNTDTYYPLNRNIDTYRMNPNQYALNTTSLNEENAETTDKTVTTEEKVENKEKIGAYNKNENLTQEEAPKISHVIRNVKQKNARNNDTKNFKQDESSIKNNSTNNSVTRNTPKKLIREDKELNSDEIKPVENKEKDIDLNSVRNIENTINRNEPINSEVSKQKTHPIKIENNDNLMATFFKDGNKKLNDKNNHVKEKIGTAKEVQFT